jgi:hypothetical protein
MKRTSHLGIATIAIIFSALSAWEFFMISEVSAGLPSGENSSANRLLDLNTKRSMTLDEATLKMALMEKMTLGNARRSMAESKTVHLIIASGLLLLAGVHCILIICSKRVVQPSLP